jgi:hypothetical protein
VADEASTPAISIARSGSAAQMMLPGNAHCRPITHMERVELPALGRTKSLAQVLAAATSLAPPRLNSSCTTTSSNHASTTASLVRFPLLRISVFAVSRANSVSSVLQVAPALKSVMNHRFHGLPAFGQRPRNYPLRPVQSGLLLPSLAPMLGSRPKQNV